MHDLINLEIVMDLNGDDSVHVPMSPRARTSVLDLWLSMIKWTKSEL